MTKKSRYALVCTGMFLLVTIGCKKDSTPPSIPSIATTNISNITTNSATTGGTITSDGGAKITSSGVVWSKSNMTPLLTDSIIKATTSSGSFAVDIVGLEFNTTYYIRAFATNSVGTGYGNVVTLNTTNDTTKIRFTYNNQQVVYGVIASSTTGRKWMDRNLGAARAATAPNDSLAYGDLFQWGRGADGHQLRNSGIINTQSSSDVPGHAKFITPQTDPYDWRIPQNANLWQGSTGINNPCPNGWHVPTQTEWANEVSKNSITNYNVAYSVLKLTVCGSRYMVDGIISGTDNGEGDYWTSTPQPGGSLSRISYFTQTRASTGASADRGQGNAIRCIKD